MPTVQPTIFHLIAGLTVGGAEMTLLNLLERLPPDERDWHQVVSLTPGGAIAARLTSLGVTVHDLGLKRGHASFAAIMQLRRILKSVRNWRLQGWMYHGNLLASVMCIVMLRPRRHAWAIHNSILTISREKGMTQWIIYLSALISRLPSALVYVARTSAMQHEAIGYSKAHRQIIPNGIDLARFTPDAERKAQLRAELNLPDVPIIGHVARYNWAKDHETFVRALGRLARAGVPFSVVMVGADVDAENAYLMTLLREQDLLVRTRLLGRREDVPQVMQGLDIFCLSSRTEALPLVLAEAMACGVPCVTTNVGDAPFIVSDYGIVMPPEDTEALSRGLALALTKPLAQADDLNHHIATHYPVEGMISAYQALYQQLGWGAPKGR